MAEGIVGRALRGGLLLAVIVVGACDAARAAPIQTAPPIPVPPVPLATVAPSPTVARAPTIADAADAYLALARSLNRDVRLLADRVDAARDTMEMRAISTAYAEVEGRLIVGLRALPVLPAIQAQVDTAIVAAGQVRELNLRAADPTTEDLATLADELTAALDAQRAALIALRTALGLPATLG